MPDLKGFKRPSEFQKMHKIERMERALKLMCAHGKCEHYTSRIGECFRSGRTDDAEFLADRACKACVAYYALHGGFPALINLAPAEGLEPSKRSFGDRPAPRARR